MVNQLIDKHDKLRKLSRNLAIVKMLEEEWPAKSYADIAQEFNITKQRVSDIKKSMDKRAKKLQAAELTAA